ncbi:N-formylglutamate amidohydrolase [Brevundimonas sp. R86498]|uniref:N-formylglutamate amidohydrolase n=1 Tax=Brevundimonas sp. R86498 TaxID=3093845 RepID=UPI0037CA84FC
MIPPSVAEVRVSEDAPASFALAPARGEAGQTVFASPHSGAGCPKDMRPVATLAPASLRSAEDVAVDRLVASGPAHGAPLIAGLLSRAYVDLNRAPDELDPLLIEACPAAEASATAKVGAGFGVIPRRAGDGAELYDRRLSLDEARARLALGHAPYHAALSALMHQTRDRHGTALLVDWHSMPSRAVPTGRSGRGVDVILGDRHGAACRGAVTRRVRSLFEAEGWRVGLNTPYAGGYSTQIWGQPDSGFQAIQVELNRALYLDEQTLEASAEYGRFLKALERVIARLAAEAWPR